MNKPVVITNSTPKNTTIRERSREVYKNFHNLDRKALINKFVEELFIDERSARTHISWCAKELNPSLNKPFQTRKRNADSLKKEKAYVIFKSNPNLSRKEIIKLYQSNLKMTENSAATHCSLSSKRFMDEFSNTSMVHSAISKR